jgi:hypothetical protein
VSLTIVAHGPDNPNRDRGPGVPLIRGTFTDRQTDFTVWSSAVEAPDSFQVAVTNNPADLVLIVSGVSTGMLHATWGEDWRAFVPDWKAWFQDTAFKVFYTGRADDRPTPGKVRFCDG